MLYAATHAVPDDSADRSAPRSRLVLSPGRSLGRSHDRRRHAAQSLWMVVTVVACAWAPGAMSSVLAVTATTPTYFARLCILSLPLHHRRGGDAPKLRDCASPSTIASPGSAVIGANLELRARKYGFGFGG
jgi:hypothetical protein